MTYSYTSTESWTYTYITNLGQVCLFSDLIAIPVQCREFCIGVVGTQLFFTGFKVGIYWEMIKI